MPWLDLEEEIAGTFSLLQVPTFKGFATFGRSERVTVAEKRAAAKEAKRKAKESAYNSAYASAHRAEKRDYDAARYRAARASETLVPVLVDGVIWMRPPPAVEERRAHARRKARLERALEREDA